jgi:hypothetical protein
MPSVYECEIVVSTHDKPFVIDEEIKRYMIDVVGYPEYYFSEHWYHTMTKENYFTFRINPQFVACVKNLQKHYRNNPTNYVMPAVTHMQIQYIQIDIDVDGYYNGIEQVNVRDTIEVVS